MVITSTSRIRTVIVVATAVVLFFLIDTPTTFGQQEEEDSNNSYVGPGYLACPTNDYDTQPCELSILQSDCTIDELFDCNFTSSSNFQVSFSDDFMTVYIPLACQCLIASDCPTTCIYNNDDGSTPPTTQRPPVGTMNFTGIGTVSCLTIDFINQPCYPTIQDFSSCGTCDTSTLFESNDDDDDNDNNNNDDTNTTSELEFGNEYITFPLLCECFVMNDCPDTCTFTPGLVLSNNETNNNSTTTETINPSSPPPSFGLKDFMGVGTVTCNASDYLMTPCIPSIDNFTACSTCDFVSSITEITNNNITNDNEELISFPLLCECFVMKDCPDTCTFTPGMNNLVDENPTTTTTTTTPTTTTTVVSTLAPAIVAPIVVGSPVAPPQNIVASPPPPTTSTLTTPTTTTTVSNSSSNNSNAASSSSSSVYYKSCHGSRQKIAILFMFGIVSWMVSS